MAALQGQLLAQFEEEEVQLMPLFRYKLDRSVYSATEKKIAKKRTLQVWRASYAW